MVQNRPEKKYLRDLILDINNCPVARMRLFSQGVNENTRIFSHETVIGDRACLACGNCVDACPVVYDAHGFVFIQNQRTSMALENLVGDECRRCYNCIQACPQVAKPVKDHAASFRRGEKVVHLLLACTIVLLAVTGVLRVHYGQYIPPFENSLFSLVHRALGFVLIFLPFLYYMVDRHHLFRLFRKVFVWKKNDLKWFKDLGRHIKNPDNQPMPYTGEYNPGQRAWYLFITLMIPIMAVTGILMMGFYEENDSAYTSIFLLHVSVALATDLLLFVHIYLKYLRKWAMQIRDLVKVFMNKRHLNVAELYGKKL